MKKIKEMTLKELRKELEELSTKLNGIGDYKKFCWNGLDYWQANRRCYELSQEVLKKNAMEFKKV